MLSSTAQQVQFILVSATSLRNPQSTYRAVHGLGEEIDLDF
jgi:hypothetical protein